MNNDWAQVTYGNGDVTLFNMDTVDYMLKHTSGLRKLGFSTGADPILLDPTDTLRSKTQTEVEAFLGGPFVKLVRDDTTLFAPVKSLVAIHKVGPVVTVVMSKPFIEATGDMTVVDELELEGEFG